MYLLAITFAGGIRELQEGDVFEQTPIESLPVPTIDVLGIYPTVETFGVQVVLLIIDCNVALSSQTKFTVGLNVNLSSVK